MNFILDFVKQGGYIGYILVALNFIGYAIIIWKVISLIVFNKTPLTKGLTTVENIASISPMLGLLGTVVGIFNAFTVIAASGLDDPSAFATGIKFALVTTVLGLVVAIPHVIAFNYLNARMEQEQDEVENQVLLHLGKTLQERDAKRTESRNG